MAVAPYGSNEMAGPSSDASNPPEFSNASATRKYLFKCNAVTGEAISFFRSGSDCKISATIILRSEEEITVPGTRIYFVKEATATRGIAGLVAGVAIGAFLGGFFPVVAGGLFGGWLGCKVPPKEVPLSTITVFQQNEILCSLKDKKIEIISTNERIFSICIIEN